MRNKAFFIVYSLVVFVLGGIVGFAVNQPSDDELSSTKNSNTPSNHQAKMSIDSLAQADTLTGSIPTHTNVPNLNTQSTFNTQQFNEQSAKQLVNTLPDNQLNQYVGRFISSKDAELITDKRQFANRAIEELYKQNDNQPMVGQILLSNSKDLPNQSLNTSTLQKRQKLYAHLNTFGKVPLGANVFVKWVNRNTGEVLLFEKKLIVPNSDNNWVSFQPYESWQPGSYDIRFYQFTSQLEPVAQLSYDVNQVID